MSINKPEVWTVPASKPPRPVNLVLAPSGEREITCLQMHLGNWSSPSISEFFQRPDCLFDPLRIIKSNLKKQTKTKQKSLECGTCNRKNFSREVIRAVACFGREWKREKVVQKEGVGERNGCITVKPNPSTQFSFYLHARCTWHFKNEHESAFCIRKLCHHTTTWLFLLNF